MTDKHPLNPFRLLRAIEMWAWYGRAWNVGFWYLLRFHHRPLATAQYLASKRQGNDEDTP